VVCDVVVELLYEGDGDVLVFLLGECEICDIVEVLCVFDLCCIEVFLLYVWLLLVE